MSSQILCNIGQSLGEGLGYRKEWFLKIIRDNIRKPNKSTCFTPERNRIIVCHDQWTTTEVSIHHKFHVILKKALWHKLTNITHIHCAFLSSKLPQKIMYVKYILWFYTTFKFLKRTITLPEHTYLWHLDCVCLNLTVFFYFFFFFKLNILFWIYSQAVHYCLQAF